MDTKFASNMEVVHLDSSTAFLPGGEVLLVDDQPAVKPSVPLDRKQQDSPLDIVQWGPNNRLPQQVIMLANKSPELLALIKFVVYFMYGGGLTYEIYDTANHDGGKARPKYVEGFDAEVDDFIENNRLSSYLLESVIDMVWFNHGFSELILNKKRDRISQIVHQEAAFCRFGKPGTAGYSDKVYINANWGNGVAVNDPYTIPVDAINVNDRMLRDTIRNADYYKFIYPTAFPGPGNLTYQCPDWVSLFESGYYDISILVPVLKRAMMKFTMNIKYIIKVPQEFWVKLAREKAKGNPNGKDWEDMDFSERKKLRADVLKEMNDFLTGAENAGKSFLTTFGWDDDRGQEIPGISIEGLDDKLKDGIWIADSQEASSQFIRSFNLVPAIVGHLTGKGMGAGSGSDVRVHGNVQNKLMASRRDIILEPLQFLGKYNGFNSRLPGFRWKIKDFQFDTLDVNHSTTNDTPTDVKQAA